MSPHGQRVFTEEGECQVQRNQSPAVRAGRCRAGKLLEHVKMLVQRSLYATAYTTTCVTLQTDLQFERKSSVFVRSVFHKRVQTKPSPPQQMLCPAGRGQSGRPRRRLVWSLPGHVLSGSPHKRGLHRIDPLVFWLCFIHLHRLHLPLRQTGTCKAGAAGSGRATSPPSV